MHSQRSVPPSPLNIHESPSPLPPRVCSQPVHTGQIKGTPKQHGMGKIHPGCSSCGLQGLLQGTTYMQIGQGKSPQKHTLQPAACPAWIGSMVLACAIASERRSLPGFHGSKGSGVMTCTDGGASSGVVSDVLIAREFLTAREIEFGRTTLRGAK